MAKRRVNFDKFINFVLGEPKQLDRYSMSFGEADKKESAFGKKRRVSESARERSLLDISFISDDMKRHSYHGSSSFDHSTRESLIDIEYWV